MKLQTNYFLKNCSSNYNRHSLFLSYYFWKDFGVPFLIMWCVGFITHCSRTWSINLRISLIKLLTTENLLSPNHITQRVPSAARLRPLIHQETIRPGHQEKPRSFPNTSAPMPKPLPSCYHTKKQFRQRVQANLQSTIITDEKQNNNFPRNANIKLN